MTGYVKIYGSILGSSIWAESTPTRIVWITMLAMADEQGRVEASHTGLARFANVTLSQCRTALSTLSAPDRDSRTPDNDGRRVEKISGGWLILNYLKYREMRSPKQVAEAERKARWRDGQKSERDMSPLSPDIRTAVDEAVAVESSSPSSSSAREELLRLIPRRTAWEAEMNAAIQGMHGPPITADQVELACRDYMGNGALASPSLDHFRAYLKRAGKTRSDEPERSQPSTIASRAYKAAMKATEDM